MTPPIYVMGHRNPDNDAISSAIGYAWLKNQIAARDGIDAEYVPVRLGPLPPETAFVLEEYGVDVPQVISNMYGRVSDVMTRNPISIEMGATIIQAGRLLRQHNIRSLVVNNDDGTYAGLITTRMVAERYISATDAIPEEESSATGEAYAAVASDLIRSIYEKVDHVMEREVLELREDDLLNKAVEDLLDSALREAVVLDEERHCLGIVTRSDVANPPTRQVILVDHNETSQAAPGIEEVQVVEVVDHHRIGDVSTSLPIRFTNMPVGSTAGIVTHLARTEGIDIPKPIAAVLLSACLTDTVILKSPTATPFDRDQIDFLANIVGVDFTEFGIEIFKCRGGEASMPIDKLVAADAKEFQMGDARCLIAQRETVDLQAVLDREDEIRAYLRQLVEEKDYEFALLLATDIIAEGSQFISEGNKRIVERAFDISCKNGSTWMPGILSRKKQVAPVILSSAS